MRKALLTVLLLLYVVFVSMDIWNTARIGPGLTNIVLKLMFSLGCLIWIHLGPRDALEPVDFDLVRMFLLFMVISDFVFATLAKSEGLLGQLFFLAGILSACFGQLALILRHLRLSGIPRPHSPTAHRLNVSRTTQALYLAAFVLAVSAMVSSGLAARGMESVPFVAVYVVVSLSSLTAAFLYLRSKNQLRSRLLAFTGVLLLFISDSFIGLGMSVLKDPELDNLLVWLFYAPVLLLIGASIFRLEKAPSGTPSLPA
jgi:hypothetical protein